MTFLSQFAGFVIPGFVGAAALMALLRRVEIFPTFVEGVADGLRLMVSVVPYMLAVIVAVGVFSASGALDFLARLLAPVLSVAGIPPDLLPVLLIRPLSASASFGMAAHLLKTHGPDSFFGYLLSTVQGSSETTLYVLTVYFGSIAVKRSLWALPVSLFGDLVGYAAAVLYAHLLFHP